MKVLRGFFAGIGQLLVTADRFRAEESRREQSRRGHEHAQQERADASIPDELSDAERAPQEQGLPYRADLYEDSKSDRYEPLTELRGSAYVRTGRDAWTRRDRPAGRHRATGLQGPAASAQAPTRRFRSLDSTGNVRLLTPEEAVLEGGEDASVAYGPAVADGPAVAAGPAVAVAAELAAAGPAVTDLPVPGYDQLTVASLRARLRYLDLAQLRVLVEYEKVTANRADVVAMFERRIAKLQAAGRAT